MSDEIKSLKDYISTTKNEIFTTFKIETISNLIIYYEDLQQKVEQLEKRCEYLERSNNRREDEIMELRNENVDLVSKNEQLENIRKEAIEYIDHFSSDEICENITGIAKYLLNILNKGSDNNG